MVGTDGGRIAIQRAGRRRFGHGRPCSYRLRRLRRTRAKRRRGRPQDRLVQQRGRRPDLFGSVEVGERELPLPSQIPT